MRNIELCSLFETSGISDNVVDPEALNDGSFCSTCITMKIFFLFLEMHSYFNAVVNDSSYYNILTAFLPGSFATCAWNIASLTIC